MSAPDDAARAEHKRLFDAQVLKRMSGVKEKSQFLSQATHSTIVTCMQTWNSLEPKAKKTGSHGGHAYNWAKKYAVVISGEQPVLVFKPEVPVGEEAAGGTPELNTALDQLKLVSHQGSAFDDLYAVHVAGVHCKARAFQNRVSAKFGKSIPGWAVLLLAETCPVCVRKLPRKTTSAGHQPILTKGLGSRGQVDLIDMQSCPDKGFKFLLNYQDHGIKLYDNRPLESKRAVAVAFALLDIFTMIGAPAILQSDNGREFSGAAGRKSVQLSDEVSAARRPVSAHPVAKPVAQFANQSPILQTSRPVCKPVAQFANQSPSLQTSRPVCSPLTPRPSPLTPLPSGGGCQVGLRGQGAGGLCRGHSLRSRGHRERGD